MREIARDPPITRIKHEQTTLHGGMLPADTAATMYSEASQGEDTNHLTPEAQAWLALNEDPTRGPQTASGRVRPGGQAGRDAEQETVMRKDRNAPPRPCQWPPCGRPFRPRYIDTRPQILRQECHDAAHRG